MLNESRTNLIFTDSIKTHPVAYTGDSGRQVPLIAEAEHLITDNSGAPALVSNWILSPLIALSLYLNKKGTRCGYRYANVWRKLPLRCATELRRSHHHTHVRTAFVCHYVSVTGCNNCLDGRIQLSKPSATFEAEEKNTNHIPHVHICK